MILQENGHILLVHRRSGDDSFSSPSLQPLLYLFRQAYKPPGQEYDCKDEYDPDNDIPPKSDPGRLEPFPDDGEHDRPDNRAGKRTEPTENDIGNRPERVVNAVKFRCKIADVMDLECPGNTRKVG